MRQFYSFCSTYQVNSTFPLSEQLLCSYAACLADNNLVPQTIESYLSALRNALVNITWPTGSKGSIITTSAKMSASGNQQVEDVERLTSQDQVTHYYPYSREDSIAGVGLCRPRQAGNLGNSLWFFLIGRTPPELSLGLPPSEKSNVGRRSSG